MKQPLIYTHIRNVFLETELCVSITCVDHAIRNGVRSIVVPQKGERHSIEHAGHMIRGTQRNARLGISNGRNMAKKGSNLKAKLWKVFSEYIRQRDKGVCISCGKKDEWRNTDAGHYIPKTAGLSIYFDERNVNCQCTFCNRFRHGNLARYAIALRIKYGPNVLEELDKQQRQVRKITPAEYKELIDIYANKV